MYFLHIRHCLDMTFSSNVAVQSVCRLGVLIPSTRSTHIAVRLQISSNDIMKRQACTDDKLIHNRLNTGSQKVTWVYYRTVLPSQLSYKSVSTHVTSLLQRPHWLSDQLIKCHIQALCVLTFDVTVRHHHHHHHHIYIKTGWQNATEHFTAQSSEV